MEKKFNVAVVGCGDFAQHFVPLWKNHPYVEKVYVCDLMPERSAEYSKKFDVPVIATFEDVLQREDVDAVALFTDRHLHGPMAVKALDAGKHVYSAVPMASSPEECKAIIDAVQRNKKIYMMGETCVYYPCAMFCKREFERGAFGKFVYGESQYFHDISHFPERYRANRQASALPPFYYPTHSTAMLLYATGAHATKVTAFGYRDMEPDTPYRVGENLWDNEFSNEFSLMQLSNGGVARVSECRRIGYKAPSSFISGFYGTQGSYQFNNAQHLVTELMPRGVRLRDFSDQVNPRAMTEQKGTDGFKQEVANHLFQWDNPAPVQDEEVKRLPKEFEGLPNGHMASHQLLIDDFCKAVHDRKLPKVHAWAAARYTIPGLIAHESALRGGETLDIPDYGDAPEDFFE